MRTTIKQLEVNDKGFGIKCDVFDDKRIRIVAYRITSSSTIYPSEDRTFYKSYVRNIPILGLIGLTMDRRLEWKFQKAIRKVKKEAGKRNPLEEAIKHVDGVFNLDKYLDVSSKE